MEDNRSIRLLAAMDRLWFHQIIFFSDPNSLFVPKTLNSALPRTSSPTPSSSSPRLLPLIEENPPNPSDEQEVDQMNRSKDNEADETYKRKNPKRRGLKIHVGTRSNSCSPSSQSRARDLRTHSLPASSSALEIQELKGFMDLGFEFRKEHINPRIMSVLPGLRRLKVAENGNNSDTEEMNFEEEEGNERAGIGRPYLSEAWLIKRPDSPLLNLRVPRTGTEGYMKEHIVSWARTVASVLKQEG